MFLHENRILCFDFFARLYPFSLTLRPFRLAYHSRGSFAFQPLATVPMKTFLLPSLRLPPSAGYSEFESDAPNERERFPRRLSTYFGFGQNERRVTLLLHPNTHTLPLRKHVPAHLYRQQPPDVGLNLVSPPEVRCLLSLRLSLPSGAPPSPLGFSLPPSGNLSHDSLVRSLLRFGCIARVGRVRCVLVW